MPVSPGAHEVVGGSRVEAVDGVRAVGFLLVFGYHTWLYGGAPDLGAISAVVAQNTRPDFFVVVTGFVLFLPLVRQPGHVAGLDTRRYLVRRLRRIVPPYWAALAFAVLFPQALAVAGRLVGMTPADRQWPTWPDLLSHLSFTHLFFTDYWASINGSLWTMSLEMQLYLLFPLLVLAWHRWGWPALGAALLGWAVYRAAVIAWVPDTGFPSRFLWEAQAPGRLVELLGGMASAVLVTRGLRRPQPRLAAAYLLLAVGGYLVAVSPAAHTTPLREAALAVAFGALVAGVLGSRRARRVFSSRPMARMGLMSYSLFLVHEPVAWYLSELLRRAGGVTDPTVRVLLLWSAGLIVTVSVGWVFFHLVEVPSLRWARATASPTVHPAGPAQPAEGTAAGPAGNTAAPVRPGRRRDW